MSSTKRNWFQMTSFALHPHDSIDCHQPSVRSCSPGWWSPDTDIYEVDDGLVIIIDIAGLSRDEIDILVEGKILSITGCRPQPHIAGKKSAHRLEIDFGNFIKRFRIPDDIDENRIEARYDNGFLYLHLLRGGNRCIPVE